MKTKLEQVCIRSSFNAKFSIKTNNDCYYFPAKCEEAFGLLSFLVTGGLIHHVMQLFVSENTVKIEK